MLHDKHLQAHDISLRHDTASKDHAGAAWAVAFSTVAEDATLASVALSVQQCKQ